MSTAALVCSFDPKKIVLYTDSMVACLQTDTLLVAGVR
jgi:hypothetical protein